MCCFAYQRSHRGQRTTEDGKPPSRYLLAPGDGGGFCVVARPPCSAVGSIRSSTSFWVCPVSVTHRSRRQTTPDDDRYRAHSPGPRVTPTLNAVAIGPV